MEPRKRSTWAAMAAGVLVIGMLIGAALDREDSSSTPAAANTGSVPTATPTPTPTTSAAPRKTATARATRVRPKATKTPTPNRKQQYPSFVACDANIRARAATTTCGFAQNVFYEYWYSWNYLELSTFAAYSSAAGEWFDMTCRGSTTIRCSASDGSEVRFPESAVLAYTERHAEKFATAHTVSTAPDDYGGAVAADSEPEYDAPTPDYGGGDLDCSDFADTDFPTPPGDPDGLDGDGDGVACES
jgi:hypothetical protein